MFRFLAIVVLAFEVSALHYDYFDSDAKAAKKEIENMESLDQLLSRVRYTPDADLAKAVEEYKTNATVSGESCTVDATKFDLSFNKLLEKCKLKAVSKKDKKNLKTARSDAIWDTVELDQKMRIRFSINPPGEDAKAEKLEKLKNIKERANKDLQEFFHTAKSSMDVCVKSESQKLCSEIKEATKSLLDC